jgi:D-threo-aldose 1-dehydrogenase
MGDGRRDDSGVIALGCAPLAGLYEAVGEDQAHATVHAALDLGVWLFDTAPLYGSGLSERRVGAALRGVPRDRFELQTKVGRLLVPDVGTTAEGSIFVGAPPLRPVFDFSAEGVRRSLEESLVRLGLDRVDTVLLHDPDDHWQQAVDEAYPAIEQLRSDGVVRRIGAGMNQSAMLARFCRETDMDVFLIAGRYTLLDQTAATDLFPVALERERTVLAAGVFNSGVLAGGDTYAYGPVPQAIRARADRLRRVCGRHGVSLTAAALQFAARHPAVESIVMGARTPEEVQENHRLAHLPIPEELWSDLRDDL